MIVFSIWVSHQLYRPAFRDGVIAQAVDAAVDAGSLYFSSAGNDGTGWRFDSVRLVTFRVHMYVRRWVEATARSGGVLENICFWPWLVLLTLVRGEHKHCIGVILPHNVMVM